MFKGLRTRVADAARVLMSRGYASARISRLTSDWKTFLTSADEEIFRDLRMLRARSRALLRDNDYFKQYIRKLKNNVIGFMGMTMKVETQLPLLPSEKSTHGNAKANKDTVLNKTVEFAWVKWCKKEFASACGTLSFRDFENLATEGFGVDGEFIFRFVYAQNAFGFALQQIDPDWLWEQYNGTNTLTGNKIVMSIERDKWDRPVAYYFTPPRHSYYGVVRDYNLAPEGKRVRVDASEIIHGFLPLRPGQSRGVPMGHTSLGRLKDLDRYENAEVINASVSAAKMGFIAPDKDTPEVSLKPDGSNKDAAPILDKVEPGTIQKLPAGWHFEMFDPKSPTSVFGTFCKQILRGIAAGLGIAYHTLTGDLEGANYSSLRQGALDERDEWKTLQQFMIEHFYIPVFTRWLEVTVGSPYLQIPFTEIERILDSVEFRPRGWDWVDPQKDADAAAVSLAAGTKTYTEVLAEKGLNFEQHMERIKYERDYITELGLEFVYGTGRQAAQQEGEKVTDGQGQQQGGTGTNQGSGAPTN